MPNPIPFECPNCGGNTLKTPVKPQSEADMDNAVCAGCGRHFTKDDLRAQAAKVADKLIRDAIKKRPR
jgi:hypothetical protein